MNKFHKALLGIPVIYAGFMIYRTPTIADALIVLGLCGLVGFYGYLSQKFVPTRQSNELDQLKDEVERESLKLRLEHIRENALREKSIRDSRAAVEGVSGKAFKF